MPFSKEDRLATGLCRWCLFLVFILCAGHVTRMGEERGPYRVLVGKPEGKSG